MEASTVISGLGSDARIRSEGMDSAAIATEIAALAEREIDLPMVRRRDEVPPSAEAISAEWLSDVLCRNVPGAAVESFELQGAVSTHTQRRGLILRYNAAGQQ